MAYKLSNVLILMHWHELKAIMLYVVTDGQTNLKFCIFGILVFCILLYLCTLVFFTLCTLMYDSILNIINKLCKKYIRFRY